MLCFVIGSNNREGVMLEHLWHERAYQARSWLGKTTKLPGVGLPHRISAMPLLATWLFTLLYDINLWRQVQGRVRSNEKPPPVSSRRLLTLAEVMNKGAETILIPMINNYR
jgi:hypothetical protein